MTEGTENTAESAPVHALVHTPGPWRVGGAKINVPYGNCREICADEGKIGIVYGMQDPEPKANARLIAAAPELLAHLRHMIWLVEIEFNEDGGHILAWAKAAVVKAESVV